ncbi:14609_t:CDS:2, partial [Dentiscutata heterogama]
LYKYAFMLSLKKNFQEIAQVLLGGVLFSFSFVDLSKIPSPVNSTFTGFQTFHPEIKNLDIETWDSMLIFTSILLLVPGVFMLMWSLKYETLNIFIFNDEKTSTSTTLFNKLLAGYCIVTGLSLDVAVLIQFIRLFRTTKQNYKEGYISLPHHIPDDDEMISEEHDQPNSHNNDCHLRHVLLLPLAAFFHVVGNVLNTVFLTNALA